MCVYVYLYTHTIKNRINILTTGISPASGGNTRIVGRIVDQTRPTLIGDFIIAKIHARGSSGGGEDAVGSDDVVATSHVSAPQPNNKHDGSLIPITVITARSLKLLVLIGGRHVNSNLYF